MVCIYCTQPHSVPVHQHIGTSANIVLRYQHTGTANWENNPKKYRHTVLKHTLYRVTVYRYTSTLHLEGLRLRGDDLSDSQDDEDDEEAHDEGHTEKPP